MDSTRASAIILGTYDHDRFKPFWPGEARHALLGYAYAHTVQDKPEAYCLAILLHAADSKDFSPAKLMSWHASAWPAAERRLPRALLLAHWVGRIASSSNPVSGLELKGQDLSSQSGRWGTSAQNPFIRLPLYDAGLINGRVARAELDGPQHAAEFPGDALYRARTADQEQMAELEKLVNQWSVLELTIRERIRDGVPVAPPPALPCITEPAPVSTSGGLLHTMVTAARRLWGRNAAAEPPPTSPAPAAAGEPLALDPYHELAASLQAISPQQQEMLLAAAGAGWEQSCPQAHDTSLKLHTKLAANLYHLVLANLAETSPLYGEGLEQMEASAIDRWCAPTSSAEGQQGLLAVLDLMSCSVVTIRLAGIEERFRSAVRLDDLRGAKLLADRVRRALKLRICGELGFAAEAGATAADGTALSDLLCLSESCFGLTYLLPRSYVERSGELLDHLHALYDGSLADVVKSPASVPPGSKSALSLLDYLAADIRRTLEEADKGSAVDLRPDAGSLLEGLRSMPPAFGVAAVQVDSGQAQREKDYGRALLDAYVRAQQMAKAGGVASSKVWELVEGLAAAEGGHAAVCSVTQAALAWKELSDYAYGRKQPQVKQLQRYFHTLRDEQEELSQAGVALRALAQGQPDPLTRVANITCAADRNGSVAMLTLRPTAVLFQEHVMPSRFINRLGDQLDSDGGLCAAADLRRLYVKPHPAEQPIAAELLPHLCEEAARVPAHLAHVLQRQQAISTFFVLLPQRLAAAGIRVLTLENEYPAGRYLLPAETLGKALDVLDWAICLDLLGAGGTDICLDHHETAVSRPCTCSVLAGAGRRKQMQGRERLRRFLGACVQDILVGSSILFGHKQSLYPVLRAEERIQGQIARKPVLSMALSDMRGTLVDRSPLHAQYAFADWGRIRAVVDSVDRRSIRGLAYDWNQYDRWASAPAGQPEEHGSQMAAVEQLVRARWINRIAPADVRKRSRVEWLALAHAEQRPTVDAALLLVRAARE